MAKNKILIVDDEADIVTMLKIRLEKNNYEVISAFDGEEGYEKARTEKPNLIILDLLLPKIDGYWVCDLLKKDIRYAKIPIIILTAKPGNMDAGLSDKVGADEYIVKPFEFETLLSKIEELL